MVNFYNYFITCNESASINDVIGKCKTFLISMVTLFEKINEIEVGQMDFENVKVAFTGHVST